MTKLDELLFDLAIVVAIYVIINILVSAPTIAQEEPTLAQAIRRELTITGPGGRQFPVIHCRTAGRWEPGIDGWQRCQRRVEAFTSYFQEAATEFNLNPWLLAAMAKRESGFNPLVRGSHGEYGIMQLHPQGVGRLSRYVTDAQYRERCKNRPGACQKQVVFLGAELLQKSLAWCGDIDQALGAYNSGRCVENTYAERVVRTLDEMRSPMN